MSEAHTGKLFSDDTRAKLSGENNPMFGRTEALHPMYGKVAANAMTVNVYSLDNVLVQTFSSKAACGEWL